MAGDLAIPDRRSHVSHITGNDLWASESPVRLPPELGAIMVIHHLLQNLSFGPEEIENLSAAYESALLALALPDRDDRVTEIIAQRIIEAARAGIRDPEALCAAAIKDLRVP
jgi:hypothetical protein